MSLGEKLYNLRKKAGYSQEQVAEKLNVTRQTVSKWETDQTVPELIKANLLSKLYDVNYEYLIDTTPIGGDLTSIEHIVDEIDWTSAWAKKYPILASYQSMDGIESYRKRIFDMVEDFRDEFDVSDVDVFLILKDILYQRYRQVQKENKEKKKAGH